MEHQSSLQPIRVCGFCQHYNPAHAVLCAQCGEPLTPPTRVLTDQLPASPPTQITSIANQDRGTVTLHIQGIDLPLTVDEESHIVLGRRKTPDDAFVTVDLSSADAHELGVSRHHAVIHLENDGMVTLEDLGSTNGTYLNEARLVAGQPSPLHSGDQIRLGRMMILFVHYTPQT